MSEILVVDDSDLLRTELGDELSKQGYNVSVAEDGFEALKILKEDPALRLLIADFQMPEMNGIELIENLRHTQKNTTIKAVIMSTESNSTVRQKCKDLGVSGWILKPVNFAALLPVIQKLVSA